MSFSAALTRARGPAPPSLPALNALESAARRVHDKWPDLIPQSPTGDRRLFLEQMQRRVSGWDWSGVRLAQITSAARVVFDEDFQADPHFQPLRGFFVAEICASTLQSFLNGMTAVYVATYRPGAPHTSALATALRSALPRIGGRWGSLLADMPELLDPLQAPGALAERMSAMIDPFTGLKVLGFGQPHAAGLFHHAHLAFVDSSRSSLTERHAVDCMLGWLRPEG